MNAIKAAIRNALSLNNAEIKKPAPTMVVSSPKVISDWNEGVERQKREKKKHKILAKLKERGIKYD